MITLNGANIEFSQIGKEPQMGYGDEFYEYTMMSGNIRRVYKGKRFYATFSYAYLLDTERATINELLQTQQNNGYLTAVINSPFGSFSGNVIMELNNNQARFCYSNVLNDYVWINWEIRLKGVGLV